MTEKQKRIEAARDFYLSGYNCAQSTVAPFFDVVGMDKNILLKASAAFGGGVAKTKNICGVVSGLALIYGLNLPDSDLKDNETKTKMYDGAKALVEKFGEINDTTVCAELLEKFEKNPLENEKYKDKPCLKLVEDGAEILCDYLGIK